MALALLAAGGLASPGLAKEPSSVPSAQQANSYYTDGLTKLKAALALQPNTGKAKNVILFIGDGMGISTITATRIYAGQQAGRDGPSNSLAFEALPYLALSKTYSHDSLVTDSAPSASAMMTGVKTKNGSIGVDGSVIEEDCNSLMTSKVTNLAELAKAAGRSTGAVTTTRITDATPASTYGHTPFRRWEGDQDMPPEAKAAGCIDLARQLVEAPFGGPLDVVMGGGRSRFRPEDQGGGRTDGLDLIEAWQTKAGSDGVYVSTAAELAALKPGQAKKILGLFAEDSLPYEAERAMLGRDKPTLTAMTVAAIDALSANPKGYFLMVEGGRIDHGNHANNAYRTLTETIELSKAVAAAMAKVNLQETLIIVTADHSHGLVLSGYPSRTAPILGLADDSNSPLHEPAKARDGKPYTILSFATGPGGPEGNDPRDDLSQTNTQDPDYRQQAGIPASSAAHSGEDVAIFAGGPQAHLFHGVVEESYIFQVMRHALGL
jgi:alkaline phosphatase